MRSNEYPDYVYIAGPFEARVRMRDLKRRINALEGYYVTSTWVDGDGIGTLEGSPTSDVVATEYATKDEIEILSSDLLLLDTIETNDRGGKDFEAGLARGTDIEWWVVGPYRNVFQRLADAHYLTWDEAIEALKIRETRD